MWKALAWSILKPILTPYLRDRALVLPYAKRVEAARKFNVPVTVVEGLNAFVIEQALGEMDRFKP